MSKHALLPPRGGGEYPEGFAPCRRPLPCDSWLAALLALFIAWVFIFDALTCMLEALGHLQWPLDCILETWGTSWWYWYIFGCQTVRHGTPTLGRSIVLPEASLPNWVAMGSKTPPKSMVK